MEALISWNESGRPVGVSSLGSRNGDRCIPGVGRGGVKKFKIDDSRIMNGDHGVSPGPRRSRARCACPKEARQPNLGQVLRVPAARRRAPPAVDWSHRWVLGQSGRMREGAGDKAISDIVALDSRCKDRHCSG